MTDKTYTEDEVEELLDKAHGSSFRRGQVSGLEEAAKILLGKSALAFTKGDDEDAALLRDLSRELADAATKRVSEFARLYPE